MQINITELDKYVNVDNEVVVGFNELPYFVEQCEKIVAELKKHFLEKPSERELENKSKVKGSSAAKRKPTDTPKRVVRRIGVERCNLKILRQVCARRGIPYSAVDKKSDLFTRLRLQSVWEVPVVFFEGKQLSAANISRRSSR